MISGARDSGVLASGLRAAEKLTLDHEFMKFAWCSMTSKERKKGSSDQELATAGPCLNTCRWVRLVTLLVGH